MKKIILPIFIIIFLLFVIRGLVASIITRSQNQDITVTLEEDYKNKQKQNAYLKEKLAYAKSNEFIEKEARNKLGLVREGEYIILGPPLKVARSEKVVFENDPNWKKWYTLFF